MRVIVLGLALAAVAAAHAADKVKIGFISTLSGPNAAIGTDIRDAFNLAVKLNGGKRNTRGHYDVPMRDCTVALDGKAVIERGKIVDERMRVKRETR